MADHGNVGIKRTPSATKVGVAHGYATDKSSQELPSLPCYGVISGACVDDIYAVVGEATLTLLYGPTKKQVGITRSGASGLFEFRDLYMGGSSGTYILIAEYSDYNARVYTNIQAINPYI